MAWRTARRSALRRTVEHARAVAGALLVLVASLWTLASTRWAKDRIAHELARQLSRAGLTATFRVHSARPWNIIFDDVHVADARSPGTTFDAVRVAIRPRLFMLLAGKIQASSIDLDTPVVRVAGSPDTADGSTESWKRARQWVTGPWFFQTLTARRGRVEVLRPTLRVVVDAIDLDAHAGSIGGRWAARAAAGSVEELTSGSAHRDVLCAFEASGNVDARSMAVERIELRGVVDAASGTAACAAAEDEPNLVVLDGSRLTIDLDSDRLPDAASGHVATRAPLQLIDRFESVTASFRGWARVEVDGRFVRGWRLPEWRGLAELHDVRVGKFPVAQAIHANFAAEDEVVTVSTASADTTSGPLRLSDVVLRPFVAGCPIRGRADGGPLRFEEFLRAVHVARHPHVAWAMDSLHWAGVSGTLSPLELRGDLTAATGSFAVFDGACDVERCARIWGFAQSQLAAQATLTGEGIEMDSVRATLTGGSARAARVVIGFHGQLLVEGGYAILDLGRDSPLAGIEIGGRLRAEAGVVGGTSDPMVVLQGSIDGFSLGRYPFGDVSSVRGRYSGGRLTFADLHARKGRSAYQVPALGLTFGRFGRLAVDALVSAQDMDVRDLLSLGRLDEDRRLVSLDGSLRSAYARVRYVRAGSELRGHGTVSLQAQTQLVRPSAFGSTFDEGAADLGLVWRDPSAGLEDADVDLRSLVLRDQPLRAEKVGPASIVASGRTTHGVVDGLATVQRLPLGRIAAVAGMRTSVRGWASGFVHATGSLRAPALQADVEVTPVSVGGESYGPSVLHFEAAGGEQTPWRMVASGTLLGGHVRIDALTFDGRVFRGRASIRELAVAPFVRRAALGADQEGKPLRLRSSLSGDLTIERFDPRHVAGARASFALDELSFAVGDKSVRSVAGPVVIDLVGDAIVVPPVELEVDVPPARAGTAVVHGRIASLSTVPSFDVALVIPPVDLALLVGVLPDLVSASGTLSAELNVTGTTRAPVFDGRLRAEGERARVSWVPGELREVEVDMSVDRTALRLRRASAVLGDGVVRIAGASPIVGGFPEQADLVATAHGVHLPVAKGIDVTFDSNVRVRANLGRLIRGEAHAVAVDGSADLAAVVYTKPLIGPVDAIALAKVAGHARRHEAKPIIDPAADLVDVDVALRARGPVRVDQRVARVSFLPAGDFRLRGTNRRPVLLGRLLSLPGGKLNIGPVSFDVDQGTVDFDDPTGIVPRIDVKASTRYRRLGAFEAPTAFAAMSPGQGAQSWRIRLGVQGGQGDVDVRLTSDPPLAESDIVLLLTLGVTRPELDAMQAIVPFQASAGLAMLAGVGGAQRLVQSIVPIDELRFDSVYSPETLTIIPDVTVAKRIGERMVGTVSTSFTYGAPLDRIVGGTMSWALWKDAWFEALWQNVASVPVYPVGDFGFGVRWGHEFR